MHTFYINLDREIARHAHMEDHLAEVGLAAERLRAIEPHELPADLVAAACDIRKRHHVTPPELACTMSHRKAWSEIVARDLPMALVLEDDVYLSRRLSAYLALVEPLTAGLDVIRIETQSPRIRLGKPTASGNGLSLHPIHTAVWGCGGYIVTRAGAERLLGPVSRYDIPVDHIVFDYHFPQARQLRTRQVVPAGIANGDAAEVIQGQLFESSLHRARHDRYVGYAPVAPSLRPDDPPPARPQRPGLRGRLRRWIDLKFRGIVASDIPLY